jgi:hypothetical protein
MVTMEHDTTVSAEREKVSNFVRQRIAALTTARLKIARPPCSPEENGDTCTHNGGSSQVESITEKDDNRKDILADEELQHAGCPICIACFAGMQSSEQVQRIFSLFNALFRGILVDILIMILQLI